CVKSGGMRQHGAWGAAWRELCTPLARINSIACPVGKRFRVHVPQADARNAPNQCGRTYG
ncbi:MAG TPA: hypothetical protein VFX05_10805, partial [Casimicrobiaceae bacterium]|nr:hypothetical protein [Casimicrobiaceae bacterium]